jgi:hypothetical protein
MAGNANISPFSRSGRSRNPSDGVIQREVIRSVEHRHLEAYLRDPQHG